MFPYWRRYLVPLLILLAAAGALWLLHHELSQYHFRDVLKSLSEISMPKLLVAVALTVAGYGVLSAYDGIALLYLRKKLPFSRFAFASFLGFSLSNNFGTLLGGSTIRLRLYTLWGFSPLEIVRLMLMLTTTFWIGVCTLGAFVFVVYPLPIPDRFQLFFIDSRPIGIVLASIAAFYWAGAIFLKSPLRFRGAEFVFPDPKIVILQTLAGVADLMIVAGVAFFLMPDSMTLHYFEFLGAFLLAIILSVLSHVPGGIGVFELVLVMLVSQNNSDALLGALLAYRAVYYLLPLAVGLIALGCNELFIHSKKAILLTNWLGAISRILMPRYLSFAVFASGVTLVVSGATPGTGDRMRWLHHLLPLSLVEVSHFIGSIAGMLLMVLAHGLQRRISLAWYVTVVLLSLGIIASIAKGIDYEEAIILSLVLLAFLPCKSHFHRMGRLMDDPLSPRWLAAIGLVMACAVWLLFFAYKHVDYSNEMWWQFAISKDAPRSLRALAGAAIVALVATAWQFLSHRPLVPSLPNEDDLDRAMSMVRKNENTSAYLSLLGDKRLLFHPNQEAFLMYGMQSKSWVTMGDPVGEGECIRELAWQFYELCDFYGVWPVYYQVDSKNLPVYVEMGLSILKLGEEARVPVQQFGLEGGHRKSLRKTFKQLTEQGVAFEILEPSTIQESRANGPEGISGRTQHSQELMQDLKRISDAWLQGKTTAEKGFSLGCFREDYLNRFPIAVLTYQGERIAFANLWEAKQGTELSVDLMRHSQNAPHGTMEFLFLHLMLWGKDRGYQWFNLGMAPLSGVGARRLGPLWNKAASLAYSHGEHFYNFQGLRQYKEKFDPVWSPKYLASPGGWTLPIVLTNVSTLIAGGLKNLVKK